MRMKGKKPIFGYKDTWNLDSVFNPIIYEGIKKFKEVRQQKEHLTGIPGLVIQNLYGDTFTKLTPEMEQECESFYNQVLDDILYAFNPKNEPDPSDYGFDVSFVETENGEFEMVLNEETYKRDEYSKAFNEWRERVAKGRTLFAEYYDTFWW